MKRASKFARENFKYLGIASVALLLLSFAVPSIAEIERLPAGAQIVDVRTVPEYSAQHYPGAKNIPLSDIQKRISEFGPKNQTIVVYCRSGRRSGIAKQILSNAGYTNVINGGGLSEMLRYSK